MAFHVLNAWEDNIEVDGSDGAAPTSQSVVKIVTCDTFELNMDFSKVVKNISAGEWQRQEGNRTFAPLDDVVSGTVGCWCLSQISRALHITLPRHHLNTSPSPP